MQHVTRLILIPLLAAGMTGGAWAMEGPAETAKAAGNSTPSEYKRADANFYGKGDVVKTHPTAIIIPIGGYTRKGDSYLFAPKKKAPKDMYVETVSDWIEPITPPGATSLGIAPDAMQIREPQGDVQIALPSAPANFVPVTDNMTLPDGAVVKTGANGTAAVLFGGVDSARLMPNSEAAVQQTVTAQARSAEVDLTTGGVFSKVGTQVGVKGEYEVHTPFGNAIAFGGDFVTIISSLRTDVWVAQGNVSLDNPAQSKTVATVNSDGTGPLKIMRVPGIPDPHLSMEADTETLTTLLNFIPLANQKIKALRDKATLTADEQAYLARIKSVPCLIKLALVEPPAPAQVAVTSALESKIPPLPGPGIPMQIYLWANGMIDVSGAPMNLDNLKSRLVDIAKTNPTQTMLITGSENVTHDQLKKVLAICKAAKLKAKVAKAAVTHPPPPIAAAVVEPPATNPPTTVAPEAPVPPVAAAPAATPAPPAPTGPAPIRAVVRMDGKVNFQGATYELPGFKSKLEAMVKATPDQSIVIHAGKTVTYDKLKAVIDICRDANVQYVSAAASAPPPGAPATTEPPALNLPAPGLLMHPSMEPTPSTSSTPAGNPPTTNAPPLPGP